jgi:anti-anti-sigma factor
MLKTTLYADGLNLDLEENDEETIVHCSGKITRKAAQWFHAEIRERVIPVSRGTGIATTCRIVLNLSQVSYVDSNGLAAILGLWTDAQKKGCDVEIANHNTQAVRLRNGTGISRLFRKLKHNKLIAVAPKDRARLQERIPLEEQIPSKR